MTFSRAKSGGWVTGERLTAAQMNTLDVNMTNALDGNAGGSYSPSAAIKMGGATFEINGIGEASGEFTYVNGSSVATPKTRTLVMSTASLWATDSYTNHFGSGVTLQTDNGSYYFDVPRLPTGAVITEIDALVTPGNAETLANDRMAILLSEVDGDNYDTPAAGTDDQKSLGSGSQYDDGTTNIQVINAVYGSPGDTVTVAGNPFRIAVTAGNNASSSNDVVHGFRITWTDPGPRNY